LNIVFMGSAEFGLPALEALINNHRICGIVTTPAKPQGRGLKLCESPVAIFAEQHNLGPVLKPDNLKSEEFINALQMLNADLFVVIAFRILPRVVFSIPKHGTINIHASLLPKYRGPAPIHRAIEAGEQCSGITIFRIDDGIDTGEILLQESVDIGSLETTPELYERLSRLGAQSINKAILKLGSGETVCLPQDHSLSSKAPKLSKEEARIDWTLPATAIFNKIRAFKPFPGTYCIFDDKRLGIDSALVVDNENTAVPGTITTVGDTFFDIACNPGLLRVVKVKPEGRRVMDTHDYLLGSRLTEGYILK
jgi:methionyl-tRNA formyltransferase